MAQDSRDRGKIPGLVCIVTFCALLAWIAVPTRAAATGDRLWFSPSPGSIDYVELFEQPDQWPHARQLFSVFKFYQQHTQTPAPAVVGSNSYSALVGVDAFRLLTRWGKKIAIEEPTVKE